MLICAEDDATTRLTPARSRAAQSAVKFTKENPGVMWPPVIPKNGDIQLIKVDSALCANGDVAGCRRFWFSRAPLA